MYRPPPRRTTSATLVAALLGAFVAAGCITRHDPGAREYLDERTAATITVATRPLVFARARP